MKYRCCNKILRPKFSFQASIGDLIGIIFLGGFFGGIFYLIGWSLFSSLMSSFESGELGERSSFGVRQGMGNLVFLICLIKGLPIFLKILTFFVDYRLIIKAICKGCNKEHIYVDEPTKADPF